jgi:hypothetical protein
MILNRISLVQGIIDMDFLRVGKVLNRIFFVQGIIDTVSDENTSKSRSMLPSWKHGTGTLIVVETPRYPDNIP